MNVLQFKDWLNSLPTEYDDADITSCVGTFPSGAKRVIACEHKDKSGRIICINSMGTHLGEDWFTQEVNVLCELVNESL